MQDGGAKTSRDPEEKRRLAEIAQVQHVLDDREAGADGKAQHRGVHEESDLPRQRRNAMKRALAASSVRGETLRVNVGSGIEIAPSIHSCSAAQADAASAP